MGDADYDQAKKPAGCCLMYPLEEKARDYFIPKIPKFLETYHLTLMTLLWCGLIILFGFLGKFNIIWLIGSCIVLALQWFTDILDGGLGRYRNSGFVKWGFYTDHFLDYVFMVSIILGFHFLFENVPGYSLFSMFIAGLTVIGFMINSFLFFGATRRFSIAAKGFGPSETRVTLILINILIIIFGKESVVFLLPYVAVIAVIALFVSFTLIQVNLWKEDMDLKNKPKKKKKLK